jgi:hypothetical protein
MYIMPYFYMVEKGLVGALCLAGTAALVFATGLSIYGF